MRAIKEETNGIVAEGVKGATGRLLDGPNSPLNLAVAIGLAYIADGDDPGFHWVASVQGSHDFNEKGVPKEFLTMLADYFEQLAVDIRGGALDDFSKPLDERPAEESVVFGVVGADTTDG